MTIDLEKLKSLLKLLLRKSNKFKQQEWIREHLRVLQRLLKNRGNKNDRWTEQVDDFLKDTGDYFQIPSSDLKWINETTFILEQDSTLAAYEDKCVTEIQVRQEAPRIMARLQVIYEEDGQHSFQQIIKDIFKLFNLNPTKIYEEMMECKHKRCKGHTNLSEFRKKGPKSYPE